MTQSPLPVAPVAGVEVGASATLVEDSDGGRVFVFGVLSFAWDTCDEVGRRLAAVQLVDCRIASVAEVAFAFAVTTVTVWRWRKARAVGGVAGLVPEAKGPKRRHKLTDAVIGEVRRRHEAGETVQEIAAAVGIVPSSVRRALELSEPPSAGEPEVGEPVTEGSAVGEAVEPAGGEPEELEVLAVPAPRGGERAAARSGMLTEAHPVFTACGSAPLAGLFLALPGIEFSGLLEGARQTYGALPDGFYGLSTMLLEGVLRAVAGQPRAEGATRLNPADLGRVLGMDRAPEVKTIRRKIAQLAAVGKAAELQGALAAHHLAHLPEEALVLYVDGHVRVYQGTRSIGKTHVARLRFPAPATVETWVSDSRGDPVLVVMAEPAASLASEIRRLLPDLRAAVGDDRRVLVGFDRGGWSPTLFRDMQHAGFDVLTWRKGTTPDLPEDAFTTVTFTDELGREHCWELADTPVDVPLTDGTTFTMRQVTRRQTGKHAKRQLHLLTTRTDLPATEIVYRMGSRWRQENHFRYARTHLHLDSHDSYDTSDDDPARLVPNPVKQASHNTIQALYQRAEREKARADAALLAASTPPPGSGEVLVTSQQHNRITAPYWEAIDALAAARDHHKTIPARVPLGQLAPGQQLLDTETKLIHHAIRMTAFTTITALARDIRLNTSYARAADEAHTLARQVLTHPGDIDPRTPGVLTITLNPMPTTRQTRAVAELCEHLTATQTIYPGTNRVLAYAIKQR